MNPVLEQYKGKWIPGSGNHWRTGIDYYQKVGENGKIYCRDLAESLCWYGFFAGTRLETALAFTATHQRLHDGQVKLVTLSNGYSKKWYHLGGDNTLRMLQRGAPVVMLWEQLAIGAMYDGIRTARVYLGLDKP